MTVLPSGTVTFLFTDLEGSTRGLRARLEQAAGKRPESGVRECPTVTGAATNATALPEIARG